jgi:D-alanyl-D-alanine carboxypeptidase
MNARVLLTALFVLLGGCSAAGNGNDDDDDDDDATAQEDPTPAGPEIDADFAAALEARLAIVQEDYAPPGIQVAVQIPDHAVWTSASGSLSPTDVLKAGGVGQMFVATALLQMAEEDLIPLFEVVDLWVPGLSWGGGPTLGQLLNHTSGIPDYLSHPDFDWDATWEPEELAAFASEFNPLHGPGADFTWTHANYVVASLAIEAAGGRSWEEELDRRFFGPLELNNTRLPPVGSGWGNVAPGYVGSSDVTNDNNPSAFGAAGNLVSKASDLARWSSALFGGDLLNSESRWEMYGHPFGVSNGRGWGLGVVSTGSNDGSLVQLGNLGDVEGYTAWVGYREDLDVSVVVMANAWTDSQGQGYSQWIANEFWSVVEQHVGPAVGDDDDDDDPLPGPAGQMRLYVAHRLDPIGSPASPDHDGVELTGWWDFDNDGQTVGSMTVTSADYSSGSPVGAVECEVTVNGTYDPSDREYDITGTLFLEDWGSSSCAGWPGFEAWHARLDLELNALYMVPIDRVPDNWGVQDTINAWSPTAPGDATVPFVVLAEFPSSLPAHDQTPPFSVFGHFWQRPGDL